MRIKCAWCGEDQPSDSDKSDDVSHSICLNCIDGVLGKIGEEAEHNSWLLAFKIEREYSTLSAKVDRGPKQNGSAACPLKKRKFNQ